MHKIQCPVCKKEFKQLNNAHIKQHGYSNFKDFEIDYPQEKKLNDEIYKENGKKSLTNSLKASMEKKQRNSALYLKSPKHCTQCNSVIPYECRTNKFCNSSCAAQFNNKRRIVSKYKISLQGLLNIRASNVKRRGVFWGKEHELECCVCEKKFLYKQKRKTCSDICRRKSFSNNAKKNKLGGNHNRNANWYISPIAGKVWLESSYEVKVATELDIHKINWCRPKSFTYIDVEGVKRKYYPDFYLKDYDVYLDPKNSFLIEQDKDKIERVIIQNNIKVKVLSKEELTWDKIKTVIN